MNNDRIVLTFSLAYEPYIGGAEVAIREIAARSPRAFAVVTMRFSKEDATHEMVGKVEVIRVGPAWMPAPLRKIMFVPLAVCAGWHMRHRVSFAWGMMANYAGLSAWLFSLITGKKFFLTLQEGDDMDALLRRPSVRIIMPAFRSMFRCAARIQCISQYLCDFAARFAPRERIELVPNGVDLARFDVGDVDEARAAARAKLGIDAAARVLVTSSRLVSKNGIDRVIRALPLLPDVQFLVYGEGPDESSLRALAASLGVIDRVQFLGFVGHDELPRAMIAANAFVRLSRTEGLGNSFIEAMAMGLPTICTAVGGIVDFARDGDTAIVCAAPDDPTRTAADIERAFAPEAHTIAARGRELAHSTYGWDAVVAGVERQFQIVGGEILVSEKNNHIATRMRVAIATGIYPPDVGGPATHAAAISNYLAANGITVGVTCFGAESKTDIEHSSVEVRRVSRRAHPLLRWFEYAYAVISSAHQSAVTYAFDLTTAGLPAAVHARFSGKPLLLRVGGDPVWERTVERGERSVPFDEYFKRGYDRLDRPFLRRVVGFVARSAANISVDHEGMRNHFIERYAVHPSKIVVVPNPSSPTNTSSTKPERLVVLYAGRFVSYKNLPNLVRAMATVRKEFPNALLRLVGEGPAINDVRAAIIDAGSTVDVVVEPAMSAIQLAKVMGESSIVVMPALSEFNPNVALSALAMKKPVAISRGSGLSRPVPNDWMFNPSDPESIAGAIIKIANRYDDAVAAIELIPPAPTWEDTLARHAEFVRAVLRV